MKPKMLEKKESSQKVEKEVSEKYLKSDQDEAFEDEDDSSVDADGNRKSEQGFMNPFDVNYIKNNASMSAEKFEQMLKPKMDEMKQLM